MTPAARFVAEARKHLGYRERPGNRTKFADLLDAQEKPPIPRNGSAWCGTFADCSAKEAGVWAAFHDVSFFSTQNGLRKARRTPGLTVLDINEDPQPGDLLIKTYTPTTGHVGIVDHYLGDHRVLTIEGNTSLANDANGDGVMERNRPMTWWNAIVRPDWSAVEDAPASEWAEWVPVIDVAKYQGDIDWWAVGAFGVRGAIVKYHNTRELDPKAVQNLLGARKAGLLVGAYWYARSWIDRDPARQARNDVDWGKMSGADFFMADIESGENCPLTPQCIAWWNDYIGALPDDVWLYGGANYLAHFDQELVRRHPVITARYPRGHAPHPAPAEWDEHALRLDRPKWPVDFPWAGWQFTSSGTVPGINARTDLNIVRATALGLTPTPGGDVTTNSKLVQEAGKPAIYLAHNDGIVYRWIKDQAELAWQTYAIHANGGDPTVRQVPAGELWRLGILVGPEPVQ